MKPNSPPTPEDSGGSDADVVLPGDSPADLSALAEVALYGRDQAVVRGEDPETWNRTASTAFNVLPKQLLLALRATLPMPKPGERYHARGMSALWLARHYRSSPHTSEAYARALTGWLDYCQLVGLMPLTAITPDVDEWTQQLAASGASASVINQRLAGIGSWYRYLRLGVATTDPVSDAWRPEPADTDESETPFLTIAENGRVLRQAMKEIQDAADNPLRRERALRFAALVWLLSTTGIRSGAVLAAWVGDLRHNGGHQYLRHQLKGHADPVLDLLPAQVTTIIAEYHACRAGRLGLEVLDPEAPLLATISSRGDVGERAPDGEAEKKALRKLAARAGIGNAAELTLHSLRHTAASGAHNELDIPLDAVRRHLRHKSIVTTQKYVHPHLKTGTSVAEQLAVAYSAEIVAPGAGTLARAHHPIDGMTTQAALAAHAKVDALRKLAATEHGLGPAGVAEVAATMAAVIDRCDAADAAFGPLAEAIRAVIAGGMPSIDVS